MGMGHSAQKVMGKGTMEFFAKNKINERFCVYILVVDFVA